MFKYFHIDACIDNDLKAHHFIQGPYNHLWGYILFCVKPYLLKFNVPVFRRNFLNWLFDVCLTRKSVFYFFAITLYKKCINIKISFLKFRMVQIPVFHHLYQQETVIYVFSIVLTKHNFILQRGTEKTLQTSLIQNKRMIIENIR